MFRKHLAAKLTATPAILAIIVCFYGTILWTFYMSLTKSGLMPNYTITGFHNYAALFKSSRWNTAYKNMLIFGSLFICGSLIIGTLLATLLDRRIRGEGAFRLAFLYPMSMSFVVTGLAWQWILNPTTGIQQIVRGWGLEGFAFNPLASTTWAIWFVSIAAIWQASGLVMAIMLAGLRGIDNELWNAARIDSIPIWRTYISIILPILRPLTVTCVVLLATAAVKNYDLVVAMTGGGPGNATDVPGRFVVDTLFQRANIGQATAAAMLMLATVAAALAPYAYISFKKGKRA